jgi:very-short-patch-repair endonuclease
MERDREVSAALKDAGWDVVRAWESEVLTDTSAVADRVERQLR